jgi:hypothetical protein
MLLPCVLTRCRLWRVLSAAGPQLGRKRSLSALKARIEGGGPAAAAAGRRRFVSGRLARPLGGSAAARDVAVAALGGGGSAASTSGGSSQVGLVGPLDGRGRAGGPSWQLVSRRGVGTTRRAPRHGLQRCGSWLAAHTELLTLWAALC